MRTLPGPCAPVFFVYYLYASTMEDDMKHKVYSVYDSKAQVFMLPIYMRADGEALRAFQNSIGSAGHQFASHPGDYTMFGIGEFDDDTGKFVSYDTFVNLGNGVHVMKPEVSNG